MNNLTQPTISGATLGLSGHYSLEVRKAATGELVPGKQLEFDNLITNQGLDRIAVGGIDSTCFVGTGVTTPAVTDTQLATYLAETSSKTKSNVAPTSPDYFSTSNLTFTFTLGAATGNLTEVGVGWGSGSGGHTLFSRALILDGGGSPTTLTILSDEILIVVYSLRVYPKITDETYSVTISGVPYSVTARLAKATNNAFNSSELARDLESYAMFDGGIGAITGSPSGATAVNGYAVVGTPYVAGSYTRSSVHTIPTDKGNVAGGVKSMILQVSAGMFEVNTQLEFTPVIPKDNTKSLILGLSYSWSRRP